MTRPKKTEKRRQGFLIKGSINRIANKSRDIAHKVIYGRNDLSPKVKNILKQIGDATITGMTIGRVIINALTTGVINALSNVPYDKLYHLFLQIKTNIGEVLLEKNEVINMGINSYPRFAETYDIKNVPPNLTVNNLLENTEKRMGRQKFLSYSAYDNNCQHFILNVLQANGIIEGTDFIKQNTEGIFENNDSLRKFANTITDVAGRANVVIQGGDIERNHVIIGGVKHYL